jgi:DNA-binding XRE family transcriptional regulator
MKIGITLGFVSVATVESLAFGYDRIDWTDRYTDPMHGDADESGMARAGAAFADRRQYLGIKQRKLAEQGIITASSLIAFEKGRSWPRERTRAVLEDLVQWPAGTLAQIRAGGPIPGPAATGSAAAVPADEDGEASLIAEAVAVAMNTVDVAIAQLPASDHPQFGDRARAVLADLRKLEAVTTRAVRSSQGAAAVIRSLAAVRRRYDELTMRAAAAPGATLGQRLYTARRRANLTVAEAAAALAAPPQLVIAVENEETPPEDATARIETLIADLEG